MPVLAETPDQERLAVCYEARDWNCAFDGLATLFETPDYVEGCHADDTPEGCGYEGLMIFVSGIGAAEKSSASDRRVIAERALAVMNSMSDGEIEAEGEIHFSALRYDACKAVDDKACMAESISLMRIAIANGYGDDDWIREIDGMLSEEGVRYPLDLAQVMNEVVGMEKQE